MAALLAVVEPRLAILNAEVGETRDAKIIAAVVNFMLLNTMFYGSRITELVGCNLCHRREMISDR